MAQICLLCLIEVAQQPPQGHDRGGNGDGLGSVVAVLLFYPVQGVVQSKPALAVILRQTAELLPQQLQQLPLPVGAGIEHCLHRREPAQLVCHMVQPFRTGEGGGVGFAGGDVAEAEPCGLLVHINTADIVGPAALQHGRIHGTRSDHADDIPADQPLCLTGVLGLLADSHLVALGNEPLDIPVAGVVGYAAHGRLLSLRFAPVPCGEGEVQLLAGQLSVLVEHLIKIPQPEKEDGVLVLFFDLQVLPHHRCHFRHCPFLASLYQSLILFLEGNVLKSVVIVRRIGTVPAGRHTLAVRQGPE